MFLRMSARSFSVVLLVSFALGLSLTACTFGNQGGGGSSGGGTGVTTGGTTGGEGEGEGENLTVVGRYLQWKLSQSGQNVSSVELSDFGSTVKLTPHASGDYLIISSFEGQDLRAYPFKFNRQFLVEGVDSEGKRVSVKNDIQGDVLSTVWIPLDQQIDKLTVMSPNGSVILEVTGVSSGVSLKEASKPVAQSSPPALVIRNKVLETVQGFPHIQFFGPNDGGIVPFLGGIIGSVTALIEPTQGMKDEVITALQNMSPTILSGVTHIGFSPLQGLISGGRVDGTTYGSVVLLNPMSLGTEAFAGFVFHEVAHSYHNLLDDRLAVEISGTDRWSTAARQLATQTRTSLGLTYFHDFSDLWENVHDSARSVQLAGSYKGSGWHALEVGGWEDQGFASAYGGSEVIEDIAEYVREVHTHATSSIPHIFCSELSNATQDFPIRLALRYAKIKMLEMAGFISSAKAQQCYGNAAIRGPNGIQFIGEDGLIAGNLTEDIRAGYQTEEGYDYFSFMAKDSVQNQMLIQVLTPNRISPMGVHRLDDIGIYQVEREGYNGIYYLIEGDTWRARSSDSGIVILTEHATSPTKVEGAIFFLAMQNFAQMNTDVFPLVTFGYKP